MTCISPEGPEPIIDVDEVYAIEPAVPEVEQPRLLPKSPRAPAQRFQSEGVDRHRLSDAWLLGRKSLVENDRQPRSSLIEPLSYDRHAVLKICIAKLGS